MELYALNFNQQMEIRTIHLSSIIYYHSTHTKAIAKVEYDLLNSLLHPSPFDKLKGRGTNVKCIAFMNFFENKLMGEQFKT